MYIHKMPLEMEKQHQSNHSIVRINPIEKLTSYSYEVIIKPQLATRMWKYTVGLRS